MQPRQKTRAIRLAEQMRCPSGYLGRLTARLMRRFNSPAERWTVELLDLASDERVLEIGFGPGCGLQEALRRSPDGNVIGVEISRQMIRMAARENRKAIKDGRLMLLNADCLKMPFADGSFDAVFAVNVLYF